MKVGGECLLREEWRKLFCRWVGRLKTLRVVESIRAGRTYRLPEFSPSPHAGKSSYYVCG